MKEESQGIPDSLAVFWDNIRVGTLHHTTPLSFSYATEWLASGRSPLAPGLPLGPGKHDGPEIHAFFENLLPEGEQRRLITMRHHVSSVYGLLAVAGGDAAGAIVLLSEGQAPQSPQYQKLSWEQVNALMHADEKNLVMRQAIEDEARAYAAPRLSISGAQVKMLLSLDAEGNPLRPMGATPSTHILKPDIVRTDIHLFATAANETLIMAAAALCGLPVACVQYQPIVDACLVERYDRVRREDGSLARLWQADLCQLLGRNSDGKYEIEGGPSFAECFEMVGRLSSKPAVDQRHLLRWLFFNLYVGNNDSHAKNLSLIVSNEGLRLAPFYDLMATRVYSGLGPNFAFSVGGEFEPGKIGPQQLAAMAAQLKISPKYLVAVSQDMAGKVNIAIPEAANSLLPLLNPSRAMLAERVVYKVRSLVKQTQRRLFNGMDAEDESGYLPPVVERKGRNRPRG
ncbi:type II toxin-antitoxin system HipA family toxin [Achromobacter aloeverae]|nr:type II toxin-antitoxin system HipA family toxin [Achromobacter aloeverae]